MKKTKKKVENRLRDEIKFQAKKIRLSLNYKKQTKFLGKDVFVFFGKDSLYPKLEPTGYFPYPPDDLKKIEEGKLIMQSLTSLNGNLEHDICNNIVKKDMLISSLEGLMKMEYDATDPYKDMYRDNEGFIHFRINPEQPRELIHYLIDKELDCYNRFCRKNNLNNRFRKEQIKALEVWEKRGLRKPFKQIAGELNIKEPACKKMFYKGSELLYGKKYKKAGYEKPEIKKEYLKRVCETCHEKSTCKDPCPDVIKFVEQNETCQRELTLSEISYNSYDHSKSPEDMLIEREENQDIE